MTLDLIPELVVAVVSANAVVGRALELLLRSTQFSVRLLTGSSLDKPGSLDGVQLVLLGPGLGSERRQTLMGLISSGPSEARIPVLELVDSVRAAQQVEDRHFVSWPCRAEDLKREIMATLLARSEASQDDRVSGRDGWGPQTSKKREVLDDHGVG